MILDAIKESQGCAIAVDENQILAWTRQACAAEGISLCPESACCLGAIKQLAADDWLRRDEKVVVFNTGAVQKYIEVIQAELPCINLDRPVDWEFLCC
jgi:threonine synthase